MFHELKKKKNVKKRKVVLAWNIQRKLYEAPAGGVEFQTFPVQIWDLEITAIKGWIPPE